MNPKPQEKHDCFKCSDLLKKNGQVCCRWCCDKAHDHILCTDDSRCHCPCHHTTKESWEKALEPFRNESYSHEDNDHRVCATQYPEGSKHHRKECDCGADLAWSKFKAAISTLLSTRESEVRDEVRRELLEKVEGMIIKEHPHPKECIEDQLVRANFYSGYNGAIRDLKSLLTKDVWEVK